MECPVKRTSHYHRLGLTNDSAGCQDCIWWWNAVYQYLPLPLLLGRQCRCKLLLSQLNILESQRAHTRLFTTCLHTLPLLRTGHMHSSSMTHLWTLLQPLTVWGLELNTLLIVGSSSHSEVLHAESFSQMTWFLHLPTLFQRRASWNLSWQLSTSWFRP